MQEIPKWHLGIPFALLGALGGAFGFLPVPAPASVAELADLTNGYMLANKPELARESMHQAMWLAPDSYEANYLAGIMAYQEGHLQDAVASLERAGRARPGASNVHLTLGAVYQRLQDYDEALNAYERVLRAEPRNAPVQYNMGVLAAVKGDAAGARRHFERYLALAPNAPDRAAVETRLRELAQQSAPRP